MKERAEPSPAQRIEHSAPEPQLTLQLALQCTWQCAPLLQETLPLAPTATSHVASDAQETLHDSPHCPRHALPAAHASEQLAPPHALPEMSQVWPAAQEQLVPEQLGGVEVEHPAPSAPATIHPIAIQRMALASVPGP